MRRILIVGIGAGHPDHLTLQAVQALRQLDAIFVIDKGAELDGLAAIRDNICARHLERAPRIVSMPDPPRDRQPADYEKAVRDWHERRSAEYERCIQESLEDGECGGFLVWGDPALYDSTLRILDSIAARGRVAFNYEVIPGITSVQSLMAAHRLCMNKIGRSVHITTGRNLEGCLPDAGDNVIVMLDGELSLRGVDPERTSIYWGAYLGTEHELLMHGKVCDVIEELRSVRRQARQRHGWIMDCYFLTLA